MKTKLVVFMMTLTFITKGQTKVNGNWVKLNDDGTWRWIVLHDNGTWQYSDSVKTEDQPAFKSDYENWNSGLTIRAQVGAWVPIGNMSRTLKPGANFGFWIGAPVTGTWRADLGMSFFSQPKSSEEFTYRVSDKTLNAKATSGASVGLQITKEIKFRKRFVFDFVDLSSGVGVSNISTNRKRPDEDDYNYEIETIHLSAGFALRRKILSKRSIGLYAQYNFTPQRLFSQRVEKGFGNSSVTMGLEYRF